MGLLGQSLGNCLVWLLDHVSEGRPLEHLVGVGLPKCGNRGVHSLHFILEFIAGHVLRQVLGKNYFEFTVAHLDIAEAELQGNIFVVNHDQILESLENCVECISDHINSHLASLGDWHWVSINGTESLLVDGVLAASWGDLLLKVVANQVFS